MIFSITLATTLYLFLAIIFVGAKIPGYSHAKTTISELGEKGSVFEKKVGFGIFLPVAIALLFCGIISYSESPEKISAFTGVCLCVAIGYLVAAFFPCDAGSPMSGTVRQFIHNLGGFVEYVGGAYFLRRGGNDYFNYASLIVIVCAILISFDFWRGSVQRIAESILFVGIILMSLE